MLSKDSEKNGEVTYILKETNQSRRQIWIDWIGVCVSIATIIVTIIGLFITIPNVISNVNNNKQTQVVIEPRDGDIIVKDGNDYKLLQLISLADITFPTKVQEIQYNYTDDRQKDRIDINNFNNEDWSKRDSFDYVINNFSINPNKVINLLENIDNIMVYCDFYTEKNIATYVNLGENSFKFAMRENVEDKNFEVTKSNIHSSFSYVTKELNDGIEWVKIRVEINYKIGDMVIKDSLVSDWISTDADIV